MPSIYNPQTGKRQLVEKVNTPQFGDKPYYKNLATGEQYANNPRNTNITGVNRLNPDYKAEPTIVSDVNIRENVIPNLKSRADSLTQTPISMVQPSSSDIAASLYGTGYQSESEDPLYNQQLKLIESMGANVDAQTRSYLSAIKSKFDARNAQLVDSQRQQTKGIEQALLLGGNASAPGGSSRYAPISSSGIISAKQAFDMQTLADLQSEEEMLKQEVINARDEKKFKLMGEKLSLLESKRQEKIAQAKSINEALAEENKLARERQIQSERDMAIGGLLGQGITDPIEILNTLNQQGVSITAKEVADAVGNLVASKTYPGGIIGEYQFYVDQTAKSGGQPVDFNTYQNMDANRKVSIARAGVGAAGLPSATLTKVQTMANAFDNNQIVKDFNTIATQIDFVNSLGTTPTDDISRVYAFAKVMDPNSAVKEGEYDTIQEYATAVFERAGLKAKRVFDNTGFLTPEARSFMSTTLESRLSSQKKPYQNLFNEYGRRINNITGTEDGTDYLTNYAAAFPTDEGPFQDPAVFVDKYYQENPDVRDQIDALQSGPDPLSDAEVIEYLGIKQ